MQQFPINYKKPIELTFFESKSVGLKEKLKSCKIIIIPINTAMKTKGILPIVNDFESTNEVKIGANITYMYVFIIKDIP
jgi:hypothetical protein